MKLSLKIFALWLVCLLACGKGSTPSLAQAASFEDLRLETNATLMETAAQVRAESLSLSGKVVELHGEVAGIVTREGARTVLLKMGDDMTILTAAPGTEDKGLLRTGILVRLLARVPGTEKNGALSILAVAPSEAVVVQDEDEEFLQPVLATGQIPTSPSKPTAKPATKKPAAKTPEKIQLSKAAGSLSSGRPSADEIEALIEAQVPAYSAIVRQHNKKLKPAVVREISVALLRAGYKHNMDPRFLAAIIAVESDFDVFCLSRSGAMGLGQMMPFNLKEAGVKNPWNPTENVMGTARLLRNLLNSYQNRDNGTLLAVAAYNAGAGAVRRAGYKVPKGAQVQRYVWKVYYRYKKFAPDMF